MGEGEANGQEQKKGIGSEGKWKEIDKVEYSKWRGRDRSRGNEEEMRDVKELDENRENGEEGK